MSAKSCKRKTRKRRERLKLREATLKTAYISHDSGGVEEPHALHTSIQIHLGIWIRGLWFISAKEAATHRQKDMAATIGMGTPLQV